VNIDLNDGGLFLDLTLKLNTLKYSLCNANGELNALELMQEHHRKRQAAVDLARKQQRRTTEKS
jgi:hypothetical protein